VNIGSIRRLCPDVLVFAILIAKVNGHMAQGPGFAAVLPQVRENPARKCHLFSVLRCFGRVPILSHRGHATAPHV